MTDHDTATTETPEGSGEPIQVGLVSGFLGAGKTTALQTISDRLTDQGYTVGMITNDQARGLVDTSILDTTAGTVVEIPGGCFCCNFEQLLNAAHSIHEADIDYLLAEPVGSCTDLVATVVNPLRSLHAEEFSVAPLTAVLDPDRVQAYLGDDAEKLPEEVRYIFRMQVEEADLIVLNKTDTLGEDETSRLVRALEERANDRPVLPVSAERGSGVDEWMSLLFDDIATDSEPGVDGPVRAEGRALTDIDYDTYAEGEAKLGWVNTTVSLAGPLDASRFRVDLMDRVQQLLRAADIEVAHLKFSLSADGELCHANLTSTDSEPSYDGADLGTIAAGTLVFNARAVGAPEEIRTIADRALTETASAANVDVSVEAMQAFRPEYPEPVHRMDGDPSLAGVDRPDT